MNISSCQLFYFDTTTHYYVLLLSLTPGDCLSEWVILHRFLIWIFGKTCLSGKKEHGLGCQLSSDDSGFLGMWMHGSMFPHPDHWLSCLSSNDTLSHCSMKFSQRCGPVANSSLGSNVSDTARTVEAATKQRSGYWWTLNRSRFRGSVLRAREDLCFGCACFWALEVVDSFFAA